MEAMVTSNNNFKKVENTVPPLIFLRTKNDTEIQKKKRIPPKKPLEKKIKKKIKVNTTKLNQKVQKNINLKPIKINQNIDLSKISSLNDININISPDFINANMLQALNRVNPRYPRRAKIRRIEGHVQLLFIIDKNGFVSDPKVIDSNPKGIFEKSALRAIVKWRFKPDLNGASKKATITFNYKLAQ